MRIGEVAELVGTTARAVRHYHRIGLVPEPARSQGAGSAAMPAKARPTENIEVQVRKPVNGHSGH